MKTKIIKKLSLLIVLTFLFGACNTKTKKENNLSVEPEKELTEYFNMFPYQETYKYSQIYTLGDAKNLNKISPLNKAVLVSAGSDKVVRMNNDTFYGGGIIYLSEGPVKISSSEYDNNRFYSFQIMDDRNVNFHNLINPNGDYYLYYGEKPENIEGNLIESPSLLVGLIVRVEVKDKNDVEDVRQAQKVYEGISFDGPEIEKFPEVNVLNGFSDDVVKKANEMMDSVFKNEPFFKLVPSPEQIPNEVSYLQLAASTKEAWGAPVSSHSTYQMMHHDVDGEVLNGNNGTYTLTTEEPDVDAFWSVTVYDTDRGGFLHPNKQDKYHINNTDVVRNEDGTITFYFKTEVSNNEVNTLEVPNGNFDLTIRYYLPSKPLQTEEWKMPNPELIK